MHLSIRPICLKSMKKEIFVMRKEQLLSSKRDVHQLVF